MVDELRSLQWKKEKESWDKASMERQTLKNHTKVPSIETEFSETKISSEGWESHDIPHSTQTINQKKTQQTDNQSQSNKSELTQLTANEPIKEPNPNDYDLPADDEEMEEMIERMTAVGFKYPEASKLIKQ
jgi:hypothetical protein